MIVTGHLQAEAWARRELPPVEVLADGLWSIPVPIPGNTLRYTLVYALALDDGVALVDAGWCADDSWSALRRGLEQIGSQPEEVRAILLTHLHPDHYGLVPRLKAASGAWLAGHVRDVEVLTAGYGEARPSAELSLRRVPVGRDDVPGSAGLEWLLDVAGVADDDDLRREDVYGPEVDALRALRIDRFLADREVLQLGDWRLEVLWTPGHAPGHVCIHLPEHGLLLAGDHLLPAISPNVSAFSPVYGDPLADYLDSLETVRELPVSEVLPAHQYRFSGLEQRVDALAEHHARRLAEVRDAVSDRDGATAYELASELRWARPWAQFGGHLRMAAIGETMAHLWTLCGRGQVDAHGERSADGRAGPVSWLSRGGVPAGV